MPTTKRSTVAAQATAQWLASDVFPEIARQLLQQDAHVTIEHDFALRDRLMADAEGWTDRGVPVYDHACNALTPENSFWLYAHARGVEGIVATCSARIYKDTSFRQLFKQQRLIYDGSKPAGDHKVTLHSHEADSVRGTLGLIGAGWVRPDFRRRHIPALLMAFAQALLLQNYDIDHAFGFVHHHDAETGLPIRSYRFRHTHRAVAWDWPGRGTLDLWLLYNTRAEIERDLKSFLDPAH